MRQDKFKKLMDGLDELTPRQRKKVVETLSEKTPLDDTLEVVNSRAVNHRRCPNCKFDQLNKWGQKDGVQRYRCKGCNNLNYSWLAVVEMQIFGRDSGRVRFNLF